MKVFHLDQMLNEASSGGKRYFEFLRVPSLSMGVYQPTIKSQDPQGPHKQDEVYYVLAGRAQMEVEGERQPVSAGSIIYVPSLAEHRFAEITEDLQVLVFFAPAEED